MSKFIIYQVLPRLFGNYNTQLTIDGTMEQNGCGKFSSFTHEALKQIRSLGATHVWYTGIIEHATTADYAAFGIEKDHPAVVKGKAGSPYAIKDYYDVDPDLADNVTERMQEFENLVERTHQNQLKVIVDFVPNHVARHYKSDAAPQGIVDLGANDCTDWHFSPLNNFYYLPGEVFHPQFDVQNYTEYPAKATGNDCFSASPGLNDWYETVKLNYGINYTEGMQKQFDPIPDTWFKMRDILLFWAAKKVDGFRCDMAEMVPVEFWNWVIPQVKAVASHIIFIAEVYNPAEYRNYIFNGKFDYLYDKVGMYDTLRNVVSRNHAASDISKAWQEVNDIQDYMLQFMENHDEQRIASGFFAGEGKYAVPAMIVAATLSKAPLMIYFGQELNEKAMENEGYSGLDGRTTIFDYWAVTSIQKWANFGTFDGKLLDKDQKQLRTFYKKLLHIALNEKAVTDGLMYDLEYANINQPKFNAHEQFAFMRKYEDEILLMIMNFDDKPHETEVHIPAEAFHFLLVEEGTEFKCTDLLGNYKFVEPVVLHSANKFCVDMKPWSGMIIKLERFQN
jgi:glycosidase